MPLHNDHLQRFIINTLPVRGAVIHLNQSLQTVLSQHHYPDAIAEIITEALVANVLLSSTLKWQGKLIMQYQGNGALELLVTQATHKHQIAAMAKWRDPLPENNQQLLSYGHLVTFVLQDATTKPYQSIIPLNPLGLTESLQDYFLHSEQLPTKLWIAGTTGHAHGLIFQYMPDKQTEFDFNAFINSLDELAIDFSKDDESLLASLLQNEECTIFKKEPISFGCSCNIKKMKQAVFTLGEIEARQALKEKQALVVHCDFCNDEYSFSAIDVDSIFNIGQ